MYHTPNLPKLGTSISHFLYPGASTRSRLSEELPVTRIGKSSLVGVVMIRVSLAPWCQHRVPFPPQSRTKVRNLGSKTRAIAAR